MTKLTVMDILNRKQSNEKITSLTAYDYCLASIFDEVGIDIILVGDSMGTVVYGQPNTLEVTLEMTIKHCQAVARGAKNHSLIVGDMPFASFGISVEETIRNATRIIKEGRAEAVKLEGASPTRIEEIKAIIDIGIPVQGHIGLLPQQAHKVGGYKVQGKPGAFWSEEQLLAAAHQLEDAGCFSIILEAIPHQVAKKITQETKVPTIGIGAGPDCDGQVLVCYDMLGLFPGRKPKFVKYYTKLHEVISSAIKSYIAEVKKGDYPSLEYSYE